MSPLDTDTDTEPTYTEPAIPPGVSEDTAFSIRTQSRQHFERMGESRATRRALAIRLERIESDLAEKPGKIEVRALMSFVGMVFLLVLFAAFQKNGIDGDQAARSATGVMHTISGSSTVTSAPEAP
jgi:hypothetical protein